VSLTELTLWGPRNKVDMALARLREFEPPEGYYLAFSGGKDSVVILRLAQMAGVAFDAHYNVTTVDPPELVRFIKAQHSDVERHRPEMSMFQYILKKKFWPPMRHQRWCCRLLKEGGGSDRTVMTGIRWQESPRRAKRRMVEACYRDKSKRYFHPIIDWTARDVWAFIEQEQIPYCSLYGEGFERLGCILCPMQRRGLRMRDCERWPQFAKAYLTTLERLLEVRASMGKEQKFETGQEMFDWWISGTRRVGHPDQMVLFE